MDFLLEVTQGRRAVPAEDRVAAFDNDGTLACEKPHTALAQFLPPKRRLRGSRLPTGSAGTRCCPRSGRCSKVAAHSSTSSARGPSSTRSGIRGSVDATRAGVRADAGTDRAAARSGVQRVHLQRQLPRLHPGTRRTGLRPAPEQVIGSEVRIESVGGPLVRTATPVPLDDGPGKTVHLWDRTGRCRCWRPATPPATSRCSPPPASRYWSATTTPTANTPTTIRRCWPPPPAAGGPW